MLKAAKPEHLRSTLEVLRRDMERKYWGWREAVEKFAALERRLTPHPEQATAGRKPGREPKSSGPCRGCGFPLPIGRKVFCRTSCRAMFLERDGSGFTLSGGKASSG
jgi:hypothetical protein